MSFKKIFDTFESILKNSIFKFIKNEEYNVNLKIKKSYRSAKFAELIKKNFRIVKF